MKTLQIILIAVTALSGCNKTADIARSAVADSTINTKPMTDSLSYLALGDSYTIGQSVPLSESYPYQLTSALRSNDYDNVKIPMIIATTGWTTDNLIAAIAADNSVINKKFDFVTLLIGVNDQYQGLTEDNYKIKFSEVLNTAIAFANGATNRVFVLSIPDYGVTPFAGGRDSVIGPEIDQFNAINKAISLKAGVNYLDITAISRTAANDPTLIADDGLHPSGKMYLLWVNQLAPIVAAKLKN